jgi:protein-disulfide isomerase
MKEKVLKSMENENYFQPSQRKIEADRKKGIKKEEERKRKEIEEIEKKKMEEKEKKRKEEEEIDKQIEKDYKEGKDVGVTNRIKFWFKGLRKGKDNEDDKK